MFIYDVGGERFKEKEILICAYVNEEDFFPSNSRSEQENGMSFILIALRIKLCDIIDLYNLNLNLYIFIAKKF